MNNLHFILNNIFTKFFKKLTKYKNDYQQYLNYKYTYIQELYYALYCILLSVSMHMHGVTNSLVLIGVSALLFPLLDALIKQEILLEKFMGRRPTYSTLL